MARSLPAAVWDEDRARRITTRARRVYFAQHADGYLQVTTDPAAATHSWEEVDGFRAILPYRSDSRMVALAGTTVLGNVVPAYVSPPDGFGWTPGITIRRNYDRTFSVDEDVADYAPTGTTYYVGYSGASDSNDGLSSGASLLTIAAALGKPDVSVVLLNPGNYTRNLARIQNPTRSVAIKGDGGRAILGSHSQALSWSVHSGSIYVAARSGVLWVYDASVVDGNGDYERLTNAASVGAMVQGSWYSDGANVYVWHSDDRAPDSDTRVYLDVPLCDATAASAITLYFENIDFEGGDDCVDIRNGGASIIPTVYAKNCTFKYATGGNGFRAIGVITHLQGCTAAQNGSDGFNYHALNGVACESIEVDCIGRHNGTDGGQTNNGSTTHDGQTKMVRVNGQYYSNAGPNVVDVNDGKSWVLGALAHSSTATTGVQPANFYVDGEMWLDTCETRDSTYDLVVNEGSMYTRDLVTDGNNSVTAGSSVETY